MYELFEERPHEILNDGVLNGYLDETDIRKVDLLNKKLKSGRIDQQTFDKEFVKIKQKSKSEFPVPKKGSKQFFDANKDTVRKTTQRGGDISSIIKGSGNRRRIDGVVDETTFNNLQRHLDICRTTDNFNEYKQHHLQICKICKMPSDSSIAPSPILDESTHKVRITFYTEKKKAIIPQNSVLYHSSKQRGINRLQGKWKSSDGVLYSSMRVYFYIGKPGNRIGSGSSNGEYVYQYIGSINNAFIDPELGGSAIFVETNTSIPVKDVTNTLNDKQVKESVTLESGSREVILNKALDVLKANGRNPKVTSREQEKWIQNGNSGMFGDSLCIAGLGNEGLESVCTKVNAEIKSYGGHLSPDNYGTAFLTIKESEDITMFDITENKYTPDQINQFIISCYESVLEETEEDDVLTEGANLENRKAFKTFKKDFKRLNKEYKSNIKNAKFKEARENVAEIKKQLTDVKKEIESNDGGITSTILGIIAQTIIYAAKYMAIMIPGSIGLVLSVTSGTTDVIFNPLNYATQQGRNKVKLAKTVDCIINGFNVVAIPISLVLTFIDGMKEAIENVTQIINNIKNTEGDVTVDVFNVYKNKLLIELGKLIKKTEQMSKHIDNVEEKYNKAKKDNEKEVKESVDFEETMTMKFVNENGELEDVRDFMLSLYESIELEDDDTEYEVTEGANLKSRRVFKDMKKQVRDLTKKYRKAMKAEKYNEAKMALNEIKKCVAQAEKDIKSFESTGASIVFGKMAEYLLAITRYIYVLIPFAGPFIVKFKNQKYNLDKLAQVEDNIKKADNVTADEYNVYKNYLLIHINTLKEDIKKLEGVVANEEKMSKKSKLMQAKTEKEVQESAEFRSEKLAIYEACNRGEITVEEREELFQNLKDQQYLSEASTDNEVLLEDAGLSNKEKFNKVRSVLYERCNNGELTIEERERLILKAKEKIFSESEKIEKVDPAEVTDKADKEMDKELEKAVK